MINAQKNSGTASSNYSDVRMGPPGPRPPPKIATRIRAA